MADVANLYLSTVIEAVNGSLYGSQRHLAPLVEPSAPWRAIQRGLRARGVELAAWRSVTDESYATGREWHAARAHQGYSMLGRARLENVRMAVETVLTDDVSGDLIETGVWRGGATIVMKATLAAHGSDRTVVVADSFEGLPAADESDDAAGLHGNETLAVSVEDVAAAFERFGLLDDRVEFLKGWFSDTLPGLAGRPWSVVRLDGDQYGSTMDGIANLYPDLRPGGFLIVDDYFTYDACRRAIHDYREEHGITEEILPIDRDGAYWRKGQGMP